MGEASWMPFEQAPLTRSEGAARDRFRALFDAYRHAIARYLAHLGVPAAELDDAVQEVLLVAASKLPQVPVGSERPFLYATAFRIAGNARRGNFRRLRARSRLLYTPGEPPPDTDELIDQSRARRLLDDALDELPSDVRTVFLLYELQEVPLAEIAERLGLPEGTVSSRLRRARACFDEWALRMSASAAFTESCASTGMSAARHVDGGDPEVLSWWVSRGEADALQALVRVFERSHPNTSVVSAAVPGTLSAREQLRSRMSRGVPPDTFQVNGGTDLHRWVRRGGRRDSMEPLDFLFASEHWGRAFPRDVLELVSHAGRIYAVPVNIHRTNALFYGKGVFADNGLAPPASLEELYAIAEVFRGLGIVPFAIGYKQPWTLTMLAFESVLVAVAGGDYYREFFSGRRHPSDPELRETLVHVARILDYANADAAELEWDGAVDLVRTGGAAMTIMGDWAKGYLISRGWAVDVDFGETPSPGAAGAFVFATDTFGLPKHASHRAGAIELLKVIGSKEGQDAFNPIKGSIPARNDADLSQYDPLARSTARAFGQSRRFPSLPSIAPAAFTQALDAAMGEFARKRNADTVVAAVRAHYDLLAR